MNPRLECRNHPSSMNAYPIKHTSNSSSYNIQSLYTGFTGNRLPGLPAKLLCHCTEEYVSKQCSLFYCITDSTSLTYTNENQTNNNNDALHKSTHISWQSMICWLTKVTINSIFLSVPNLCTFLPFLDMPALFITSMLLHQVLFGHLPFV